MYACAYISTCYTCFASTAMIFDDRWGKDGEEQIEHGTEKLRWRERRLRTDGIGNTCVHACISAGT